VGGMESRSVTSQTIASSQVNFSALEASANRLNKTSMNLSQAAILKIT